MKLRSAALVLALTTTTAAFAAAVEQNNFTIIARSGRTVGKATYSVQKVKDGTVFKTKFQYKLSSTDSNRPVEQDNTGTGNNASASSVANGGGGMITEAEYTAEYKFSDDGNFMNGYTSNGTTQIMTSFQPDKPHKTVTIGQMQGGVSLGSRTLDLPRPEFAVVPDFDPAAIQALLTSAAAHPHADKTYLLLVPGSASMGPKANNQTLYVILQDVDAAAGTLDGKPVTLKHISMNYHSGHADLYVDENNTLMQGEMGPLPVTYVRAKFVLNK